MQSLEEAEENRNRKEGKKYERRKGTKEEERYEKESKGINSLFVGIIDLKEEIWRSSVSTVPFFLAVQEVVSDTLYVIRPQVKTTKRYIVFAYPIPSVFIAPCRVRLGYSMRGEVQCYRYLRFEI